MSSLRMDWVVSEGTARVVLVGDLSENVDFSPLMGVDSKEVVFDLRGVRRINSCGVREWIRLIDSLRGSGRALVLERCSVPFVNQMNMIVNFGGNARVRSFYAPYLCTACDHESVQLCELTERRPLELADTAVCPHCGGAAEFDDVPESYLTFTR